MNWKENVLLTNSFTELGGHGTGQRTLSDRRGIKVRIAGCMLYVMWGHIQPTMELEIFGIFVLMSSGIFV